MNTYPSASFSARIYDFLLLISLFMSNFFGTANDFMFDPVGFPVFFQLEFYLGFAVFFLYFKFGFLNFFAALVNFALIFGFVFTFFVFRFVSEYDEIRFAFFSRQVRVRILSRQPWSPLFSFPQFRTRFRRQPEHRQALRKFQSNSRIKTSPRTGAKITK